MSGDSNQSGGYLRYKDLADAVGAWLAILMKISLALMLVFIIFDTKHVPILRRLWLKTSEINILGSKIQIVDVALSGQATQFTEDGKLLIGGIDENTIPDQIARLNQTVADLKADNGLWQSK